jgi:uncharacterized protein
MPSAILDKMLADIKEAMKAHEGEKVTALRTLHAEIKNHEIKENKPVDDVAVATVVQKAIKQRQDAAEQFKAGNRMDLVTKELAEVELYKKYLPQQLERAEIEAIVVAAIAEAQATSPKDMGKVMKIIMPQVKGKADGKLVNQIVNEKLTPPKAEPAQ